MLQDSRSSRTTTASGAVAGSVGRTHSRRMTGNGYSRRTDRTYVGPTSDLIVNDFDDERTLDEEEAMEGSEDSHNELSNLQKEGDMPLKELLAKYGYRETSTENSNSSDQSALIREGGNTEVAQVPATSLETEADDFEDEVEDDECDDEDEDDDDDDDGDEDDDDDDDDDDVATVRQKIISKSQPNLRQFYTEMVKKKDAERLSVSKTNPSEPRAGGEALDMYSGETTEASGTLATSSPMEGVVGPQEAQEAEKSAQIGAAEEMEGVVRAGDEEDEDDDEEDEEDDDEDVDGAEVIGNVGISGVVGGNVGGGSSRLLRSVSRPQSEEEDDDCDYSPDEEEWKKTIMVGSDYQATIPEGLCRYDDALPYENEDKILWNPSFIPEEDTEEFLERAQLPPSKGNSLPAGAHIRDDEQALYLLLQCGYNLEEALRRRRINVLPPTDAISLWSEEECHNFETGLRTYGKDFHLIQKNKVRTRSVGELVQFYYLWKKTERHDIFTYKARLEKKKYALHPGITDYMDRFLEEQEGVRDRSSSPNVNCLLLGDAKRQRTNAIITNSYTDGKSETWDAANEDPLSQLSTEATLPVAATSPSILLPPPAPPPPAVPPVSVPYSSPSTFPISCTAQSNAAPMTPAQNRDHDLMSHDYSPTDNVLSQVTP